jgi:hypothetical protein
MEGIQVKAVESIETQSIQEQESKLLEAHEAKFSEPESTEESDIARIDLRNPVKQNQEEVAEEIVKEQVELGEEQLLSEINSRLGMKINSLEDLKSAREDNGEMDEEMSAFFKYKKETGRGIKDFMKLNEDHSALANEDLIAAYLRETEMEEGMDDDDLEVMLQDYIYDEELDDEDFIKKTRLAQKKIIAKAKGYFEEAKEKYRIPAESVGNSSLSNSEEYQEYKQYTANAKNQEEEIKRRRDWFVDKTNQVFNQEFKGFEFNIGDRSLVYSPSDKDELRKMQDSPLPWIQQFTDEQGLLTDAHAYHRSLAMAMNPEKFASFFYEQGKAEAVDDLMKKTKNVNMSDRSIPQVSTKKDGMQVRSVSQSSGRGLKIRSPRRT